MVNPLVLKGFPLSHYIGWKGSKIESLANSNSSNIIPGTFYFHIDPVLSPSIRLIMKDKIRNNF